jgi:hypothetical protein
METNDGDDRVQQDVSMVINNLVLLKNQSLQFIYTATK